MSEKLIRRSYIPPSQHLTTREEENGDRFVEGYFIVYEEVTELFPGVYEKIARGAADESVAKNDVRCLYNHNDDFVLGRKLSGTAAFMADEKGVFGKVKINTEDHAAMDVYARVKRGDIPGCSYGYWPTKEHYEVMEDGSDLWVEDVVDVVELSICVFPQYEQTDIEARKADYSKRKEESLERRKVRAKKRLEDLNA